MYIALRSYQWDKLSHEVRRCKDYDWVSGLTLHPLTVGDRILGRWRHSEAGRKWHLGEIRAVRLRHSAEASSITTYDVDYDDGDQESEVDRRNIKGKESRPGDPPGVFILFQKTTGKELPAKAVADSSTQIKISPQTKGVVKQTTIGTDKREHDSTGAEGGGGGVAWRGAEKGGKKRENEEEVSTDDEPLKKKKKRKKVKGLLGVDQGRLQKQKSKVRSAMCAVCTCIRMRVCVFVHAYMGARLCVRACVRLCV